MEVRRRLMPNSVPASDSGPAIHSEHPLVERGLEIYRQLELTDFHDKEKVGECFGCFLDAAESGSHEAVDWIRTFLQVSPTLSSLPNNILSRLRWFAKAGDDEKQVRRVAKHMFSLISDSGKPIAKSNIEKSIERLFSNTSDLSGSYDLLKASTQLKSSVTHLLHASLVLTCADEITEETFVKAALKYAKGKHLTPDISSLTPEKFEDFKKANFVKRVYDYPWQSIHYAKHSILKNIERHGVKWIWNYLPVKQLYLLLLAYILPMLNVNFIFTTICSLVLSAAFTAMCIGTLQAINNSDKFSTFCMYSSVFQYFSDSSNKINTRIPETKMIQRSLGPYITFLIAAVLTFFTAPLAYKVPFMKESFGVICAMFALIVFIYFKCWKSHLVLIALFSQMFVFCYLLVKYISISLGDILPGPFFPGFSLDVSVLTVVQVPLQTLLVLHYLFTKRWYNLYDGLGPYLMFIVYWQLFRMFFILSSPLHFLFAVGGIGLFCALVPFLPFLFLISPLIFLILSGPSLQFLGAIVLLVITLLTIIIGHKYFNHIREAKWLRIPFEYVILFIIIASLPAAYIVASGYSKVYSVSNIPSVSLADYTKYCVDWNGQNMVQTQLDCLHLQGRTLSASGLVHSVKISHVANPKAESLQSLPVTIRDAITCFLGDTEPVCGNRKNMTTCINTGCHLGRNNLYEFEITVSFALKQNETELVHAVLLASDRFLDIVRNLTRNMTLHFNATFVSGMGSDEIRLQLSSLHWNGVLYVDKVKETTDEYHLLSRMWVSLKGVLQLVIETVTGFSATSF